MKRAHRRKFGTKWAFRAHKLWYPGWKLENKFHQWALNAHFWAPECGRFGHKMGTKFDSRAQNCRHGHWNMDFLAWNGHSPRKTGTKWFLRALKQGFFGMKSRHKKNENVGLNPTFSLKFWLSKAYTGSSCPKNGFNLTFTQFHVLVQATICSFFFWRFFTICYD